MINWILDINCTVGLLVSVLGILISAIIAYHVYFLSKKISIRAKLEHKKDIEKIIKQILNRIYVTKKLSQGITLIDLDVYERYYPSNNNKQERNSHLGYAIKGLSHNGVEFFKCESTVYKNKDDKYFTKKQNNDDVLVNAQIVGLLPYNWIEDIEISGDEFNLSPLIYCHFNKKSTWKFGKKYKETIKWENGKPNPKIKRVWKIYRTWSPFKKYQYYKKRDNYIEGKDYYSTKFICIEVND